MPMKVLQKLCPNYKQKPLRQEFSSAAPYDPLLDSIEPSSSSINKVDPGFLVKIKTGVLLIAVMCQNL